MANFSVIIETFGADIKMAHQNPGLFLQSIWAKVLSGIVTFLVVCITGYQIYKHLKCYTRPVEQRYIVRILFIVPIYAIDAWCNLLMFPSNHYLIFDTVRDWYEAFVIYNFLCLCFEYLGGEERIVREINGKAIGSSCWTGTCCFGSRATYSITFLRFCIQSTLQFCALKPVMSFVTVILQAFDKYNYGDWTPSGGYLYITIIYNISFTLALYGLALFYNATAHLLAPYDPVWKFLSVKSVIFFSFWQGVALAVLEHLTIISPMVTSDGEITTNAGTISAGYQNFLICLEMAAASLLMLHAFPYKIYQNDALLLQNQEYSVNSSIRNISSGLKETVNPRDIVTDAIHNFHPHYQQYVLSSNSKSASK